MLWPLERSNFRFSENFFSVVVALKFFNSILKRVCYVEREKRWPPLINKLVNIYLNSIRCILAEQNTPFSLILGLLLVESTNRIQLIYCLKKIFKAFQRINCKLQSALVFKTVTTPISQLRVRLNC